MEKEDRDFLNVSEKFLSIQGEGRTTGIPAIFLRLSGCNLLCKSSNWICDSIEVWRKGTKTSFDAVFTDVEIERLKTHRVHLVITGGEPLLHMAKIEKFLEWLQLEKKLFPVIEIETNGTITPSDVLLWRIRHWNCSPKLSNSGESKHRRINVEALNKMSQYKGNISTFKFVISHADDLIEIANDFDFINQKDIILMPAGATRDELTETRKIVVEQCINLGLRYSERLHIVIWNQKTGV
ncbi:queuosine biosynthesis QueE radical SAM [Cellulophaga phage phi47:1]|uniref:QueE-like radical SAM domain n=1 Tax=Cellulophaga phage phiSM TaxID=756280 RepID=UPI0002B78DE5|nr:QueE-like radical SAM domain [Cellulophaga phage phiSM]AGF91622.1 radical SAM domain-containing protein [Cellulophaga phage phi47:1]AGO49287.1 queuosine biosynthesis QueE radical SAM [Cellulophaga phage phi38:2]AGO49367.1 queuosine biosynthesis QueE radical SAM [Cellulophaga phage phi3:1]AGH07797.1 radical SAM domain-containing protein [Cellulophaga phage phiSM]AGO48243.1 queuosine biosynthesis QueE radical SAM [Cellulophaga phage phiSM]